MRHARTALVAAFTGIAVGATALPAVAATPAPTLKAVKSAASANVNSRLFYSGIVAFITSKDKKVAAADSKALIAGIETDVAVLRAELKTISAATTVAEVKAADAKVLALRTFEFVLPRVKVVRDSDGLAADATAFTAKEAKYKAEIAKAADAKKDVTAANKALAAFTAQVALVAPLTTSSHTAITLVRGATGAQKALGSDSAKNFSAALHLIAAIHDALSIAHDTGGTV